MGLAEPDFDSPFAGLDALYTQILSNVPGREQLSRILTFITSPLSYLSVSRIGELLGSKPRDIRLTLRGLHSVIKVPREDGTIGIHHASFPDFLHDPARSGPFYVGGPRHRAYLASCILKAFTYNYDDLSLNCINCPVAV
jgi:hypothetical protein